MKTKLPLTVLLSFVFYLLSSQIPQGFNYQAIARDASGNPITNATIKVKLSILSDTTGFYVSGSGTYVWEEEQTNVKTNAFGLFTLVLGNPSATKIQGSATSFSSIDWNVATLYIGSKIANPTDYKNLGSAKLWTVPYSMIASKAGTATNATNANYATSAGSASTATTASNSTTVTNGLYTTGSYSDPAWITSLAGTKISGTVTNATNATNSISATNANNAATVTNGIYTTGSYSDPAWITSMQERKSAGQFLMQPTLRMLQMQPMRLQLPTEFILQVHIPILDGFRLWPEPKLAHS